MNSNTQNRNFDGPMSCADVRDQLAFLLYGELSFDEEELVETHLDACGECRKTLAAQRRLHEAIDEVGVVASPALLHRCREDFCELLDAQEVSFHTPASVARKEESGWWKRFVDMITGKGAWQVGALKPVGALTLLAIGFFGARFVPEFSGTNDFDLASLASMGPSQIRSISPMGDGRVNIVFNESRPRVVSGTLQDEAVRALLLTAARGSSDPGIRAETVAVLVNGASAVDVREALVFALEHDQNSAVRLRAMEGLKSYADDPAVQGALAQVLLRDENQGLRTQAIDLLTEHRGDELNHQIVGMLQELMAHEGDNYVRERCQRVLRSVNASSEIY
ncbi:MAG: HEAT repeat domain-containing protein [Bryobacteraceae bacterium]